MRLPRICSTDGCPEICDPGEARCADHKPKWSGQRSPSSRATSESGWKRIRRQVLERDGYVCQLKLPGCTETATVVDHRRSASRGGASSTENLQAACASCNRRKSDGDRT